MLCSFSVYFNARLGLFLLPRYPSATLVVELLSATRLNAKISLGSQSVRLGNSEHRLGHGGLTMVTMFMCRRGCGFLINRLAHGVGKVQLQLCHVPHCPQASTSDSHPKIRTLFAKKFSQSGYRAQSFPLRCTTIEKLLNTYPSFRMSRHINLPQPATTCHQMVLCLY